MGDLKTKVNDESVLDFINAVENPKRRQDAFVLLDIMKEVTGEEPKMWGGAIIGFGTYHYIYASGQEGDWPLAGFSPRKTSMSLYIMSGMEHFPDLMGKLGKFKTGKSCLYVNKLEDVDEAVLRKVIKASVDYMKEKYS